MPIPSGPNACDGSTPMHSGSKSPVAHSNRTQFTGRADTLRRPLTTARVENQVCCVFRDGGVKYTILYAQTMSPRVWSIRKPFTKMPVDSSKCNPRLIRLLLDSAQALAITSKSKQRAIPHVPLSASVRQDCRNARFRKVHADSIWRIRARSRGINSGLGRRSQLGRRNEVGTCIGTWNNLYHHTSYSLVARPHSLGGEQFLASASTVKATYHGCIAENAVERALAARFWTRSSH
jgi:hypothetical protein